MQEMLEQSDMRRSLFVTWDRAQASKMGLSFAEVFGPWLNDRYPSRVPIFDKLHVFVNSNINEWDPIEYDAGNRYS